MSKEEQLTLEDLYGDNIRGLEKMANDFALNRCLVCSHGLWNDYTFILEHNNYQYAVTYLSSEQIVVECIDEMKEYIASRIMNFDGYVRFLRKADY